MNKLLLNYPTLNDSVNELFLRNAIKTDVIQKVSFIKV